MTFEVEAKGVSVTKGVRRVQVEPHIACDSGSPLDAGSSFNPLPTSRTNSADCRRGDIIWTLNQRRLETGRDVRLLRGQRVEGTGVRSGTCDELGASLYILLRDETGAEHLGKVSRRKTS